MTTARATGALRGFVRLNIRLSSMLERLLHIESDRALWNQFHQLVTDSLSALPDRCTFVDLGGGRRCEFATALPRERLVRVVAVDISAEELAHNRDVDETVVADVSKGLPFPDGGVDLLVSHAVLEHVDGVPAAIGHIARVIKPGGRTVHFMPSRNALFAMASRVLPFEPLLRLLHFTRPETVDHVEFGVHHDQTEPVAMRRLFTEAGFRNVTVQWTASQADYFKPLTPLYLLVVLYETVVRILGLSRLAGYVLVFAER